MGAPHRRAECKTLSGEIPKADPDEVRERITDALRSQLRREPTSAEVDLALEQWRRVDAINNRNKAFWDEQNPPPSPPGPEAVMRAEVWRMTLREAFREATVKAVSAFQSDHASKPRPKKKPTHKSEVIAAMRTWRADRHTTLADFLHAAEVSSIPGVSIKLAPLGDVNTYIIDCENVGDDPKAVRYRTLEHWWEEASSK
jgi:hypothetical protein